MQRPGEKAEVVVFHSKRVMSTSSQSRRLLHSLTFMSAILSESFTVPSPAKECHSVQKSSTKVIRVLSGYLRANRFIFDFVHET